MLYDDAVSQLFGINAHIFMGKVPVYKLEIFTYIVMNCM